MVILMRLTALALDPPKRFFDDKVDRSIGTMRLNYYPAQATQRRGRTEPTNFVVNMADLCRVLAAR